MDRDPPKLDLASTGEEPSRIEASRASASRPVRVTCTLITLNEADRIERAIRSVADIVDEVLVVNSGYTDGTVELCQRLGARVIHNAWPGFGPQKRFAEEQARFDWILNLDADEWLSDRLREELRSLLDKPQPAGRSFRVRVRIVYPSRDAPAPFADYHNYIRLYNRTVTRFRNSLTHDEVLATDDVVQLKGSFLHKSYRSLAHVITKTIKYYELQRIEGKRIGNFFYIRALYEFPFQFLKYYLLRRHIFGGAAAFTMRWRFPLAAGAACSSCLLAGGRVARGGAGRPAHAGETPDIADREPPRIVETDIVLSGDPGGLENEID